MSEDRTKKLCFLSILGPTLSYCNPDCGLYKSYDGKEMCRLEYLIDRLCYAVPQIGGLAYRLERKGVNAQKGKREDDTI